MQRLDNTNRTNDLYANCHWLKRKVENPQDGHLWLKARFVFLMSRNYSKKLQWFEVPEPMLKDEPTENLNQDNSDLDSDQTTIGSKEHTRCQFPIDSTVRTLLDLIVTRWNPAYIERNANTYQLHCSLTPTRLRKLGDVMSLINESNYGENKAKLDEFYSCLTVLHFHEAWASIVRDHRSAETPIENRIFNIDVKTIHSYKEESTEERLVVVGTSSMVLNESVVHIDKIPGLFDVVLIQINKRRYFGVVVFVKAEIIKLKQGHGKQKTKFEMRIGTGIYISKECRDAVEQQQQRADSKMLELLRLSNMTSSVRMISAIAYLRHFPYQHNLIMPKAHDPYFQLPSGFYPSNTKERNGFNLDQSRAIDICTQMYEDPQDRLHLIFGPPGTGKSRTIAGMVVDLLSNGMYKGRKILICAPSNSACDEISSRILEKLSKEQRDKHTLIRIGSRPPADEHLANNFLNFLVIGEIVEILRQNRTIEKVNLCKIQEKFLKKAAVIVSTLNNCASSRLSPLVHRVDLLIIDEASQALMADTFIPHRFGCRKIILVGDPNQLPPTVISNVSQECGLNRSLYDHLFQNLESHEKITTLTVQYRMNSKICSFPKRQFYKTILSTDSTVDKRMESTGLRPLYFYNRTGSREERQNDGSIKNEGEIVFVKKLCELLIHYLKERETDAEKQIAIISPYQAQVRRLRELLPYIEIMTADGAQGKEKDFIIISCVRSGDEIGFLKDYRRLNVALTRARKGLYMVGNLRDIAKKDDVWRMLIDDAKSRGFLYDFENDQPVLPMKHMQ